MSIIIVLLAVASIFLLFLRKKNQSASSKQFLDGPVDNAIVEFTDAFVVLSNYHYEACHYSLQPTGAHMSFQDYADDYAMKVLIEKGGIDDSKAYLSMLEAIGDKRDSGWILRHFGHEDTNGYWICEMNAPVSMATAEKVYEILSKSSRLTVEKTSSIVKADKPND